MVEKRQRFVDDEDVETPIKKKKRVIEDDEEETPRKVTKRVAEEDDEPPVKKKRVIEEDEEEEEPKKRRSSLKDDEDVKESSKKSGDEDLPEGMDVDFGDERIAYKKARLPRLKLDGAKVLRFALIPGFRVKAANTHYVDGQGTFICLSDEKNPNALCCQKLNENQKSRQNLRALALVVQYTNAKKDGTLQKDRDGSVDIEWEVKYLRMSRKNYNDIFALKTEDESVYDFDISMMENAETKIGFKFTKISNKAWWRQDPELEAEILAAAEEFRDGKDLSRGLGRKIDELEYKAIIRKQAAAPRQGEEEEI
jgi:hypothetical protein